MDEDFFRHWFAGVDDFLRTADGASVRAFLERCAERCSESYSLGVYAEAFSGGRKPEEALERLASAFPDFAYELRPDHIRITYSKCGCDLVARGLLSDPRLCLCSEASLLRNWESAVGPGGVRVAMESSVLSGAPACAFQVRLRALGHFD
jgi:hypothetical protein